MYVGCLISTEVGPSLCVEAEVKEVLQFVLLVSDHVENMLDA